MDFLNSREEVIRWIRLNGQLIDGIECEAYWIINFTCLTEVMFSCQPVSSKTRIQNVTFAFKREDFAFHIFRMDIFEELFLLESGYLIGEKTQRWLLKQLSLCDNLAKRYAGLCLNCIVPGNIKLKEHLIWLIKEYEFFFSK